MMRHRATITVGLLLAVGMPVLKAAAAPVDTIKNYKFKTVKTEYHIDKRDDPFISMDPLQTVPQDQKIKVRIVSLKLSSVISGRRKVAVFKELHGPLTYYLVNDGLLGSDHSPIPDISGQIKELGKRGEFLVILKQGGEKREYTLKNLALPDMVNARQRGQALQSLKGKGK